MSQRIHKIGWSAVIILFICSQCKSFSIINQEFSPVKIASLKEIAENFKNSVNNNVNPCDAYDQYICGNFDENQIISKSEFSTNEKLDQNDMKEILRKYFPDRMHMNAAELKMQDFLISCQNKDKDHHDIKEFVRLYNISNVVGGWPAFDSQWNSSKFDLVSAIAEFQLFTSSLLITIGFKEKNGKLFAKLQSKRIFKPFGDMILSGMEDERMKMLETFGVPNVNQVMSDIELFEKEYTNAISFDTSGEPEEMTYWILKNRFPQFDWDKFFEIVLGKSLEDSTPILVQNLDELKRLYNIVEAMEPRVVANYLFLMFIERLNSEFENSPICYDRLFIHFERVISRLVVNNLYNQEFKVYLMDMIRAIVETLFEYKPNYGGKTAEDILTKIENFLENEYLPNLTEAKVIETYADVQIDPENFYGNILQLYRYYMKKGLQSNFQGYDIGSKIIERRVLSYVFIRAIYDYYRKPSPIIYDLIAVPFLRKTLTSLAPLKDFGDSVNECFQHQMNITQKISYGDLISIKAVQIYLKAFDKWAEKYHDVIEKEDELLSQFDLTDKKLLFALHVQSSCRFNMFEDQSYLRKLFVAAIPNEEDFAKEFNCPLGSAMNPRIKCRIPPVDQMSSNI